MQGQHVHTHRSRSLDGLGHSIGNVVKLEVKKNAETHGRKLFQQAGAHMGKQLHAHLAPGNRAAQLAGQIKSPLFIGYIKGYRKLRHVLLGWHGTSCHMSARCCLWAAGLVAVSVLCVCSAGQNFIKQLRVAARRKAGSHIDRTQTVVGQIKIVINNHRIVPAGL